MVAIACLAVIAAKADVPSAYGWATGPQYYKDPSRTWHELIKLHRAGDSSEGIAWTEETVWRPDGGYDVIGNHYGASSFDTDAYEITMEGTYWIQLRVVDNDIEFTDYWYSITFPGFDNPESGIGVPPGNPL